jgi:hypothetical protein
MALSTLVSAPDGGEWSASCPGQSAVGPTAGLKSVQRKITLSLQEIKHDSPVDRPHTQVTILIQLSRHPNTSQLWSALLEAPLLSSRKY